MCQTDFCIIQSFCSPLARCHCQTWRDKPKEMLLLSLQNSQFSLQVGKQSPWHSQEYTVTMQRSSKASVQVPAWGQCQPLPYLTALVPQESLPSVPLEEGLVWRRGGRIRFHLFWVEIRGWLCLWKKRHQCLSQSLRHVHNQVLQMWERSKDWCPFPFLPVSAPPGTDTHAALLVLACEHEIVKEERQAAGQKRKSLPVEVTRFQFWKARKRYPTSTLFYSQGCLVPGILNQSHIYFQRPKTNSLPLP